VLSTLQNTVGLIFRNGMTHKPLFHIDAATFWIEDIKQEMWENVFLGPK
jgi:hypothetical protein